jgi:hypothetical protein
MDFSIEVIRNYDFYDLQNECWSGAIDTLNTIEEHDLQDEFMQFLGEYFCDSMPTMTELNDFIRFEDEYIFEMIGLNIDETGDDE